MSGAPHASSASPALLAAALLGLWFLAALWGGAAGVFQAAPSRPPLALLVAVVGPPLVVAIAYRVSRGFRALVLGVELRWLTAVQSWRVIGIMFLALYAFGLLPGLFAWPAGLGDVTVGVAAPFVLLAMVRNVPRWPRYVVWLNVAGLLDFAAAVGTGVLASDPSFGFVAAAPRASLAALPLSLVPTFAVPLWIIFHEISLIQVAAGAGSTRR
jgi:hypothetical protein